jgi:hypothetical protein
MTRKEAREFLNLLQEKHGNKYVLPRQGHSLNICSPGNPNLIGIWHGNGIFVVEHFNYISA